MNDDQNSPQSSGTNPIPSGTTPDWLKPDENVDSTQPTALPSVDPLIPAATEVTPVSPEVPVTVPQFTTPVEQTPVLSVAAPAETTSITNTETQATSIEPVTTLSEAETTTSWANQPVVEASLPAAALVPLAHSTATSEVPVFADYTNDSAPSSFADATPILPGTEAGTALPDIMGEVTPAQAPGFSTVSTNVPTSPSDITPDMMASFLNENKLDLVNVPPTSDLVEATSTTEIKKSTGGWIPIFVLTLMVVVVAVIIILLLLTSQTGGDNRIVSSLTTSTLTTSTTTASSVTSAESATSSDTTFSVTSSLPAYTATVPAGWLAFTDGFIGLSFALPPQDGYVEVQVPTTPQTATTEIRQQWLAKPAEWFYSPSSLAEYFGTGINSKTLRLNRAPGRASGIGSICNTVEIYCHIDISLNITRIDFDDAIGDLVAKIKAANPNLKITTGTTASVWGGDSITLTVDYGTIQDTPQVKNFTLIKKGDSIYSLDTYTKQTALATELNTAINAISILP